MKYLLFFLIIPTGFCEEFVGLIGFCSCDICNEPGEFLQNDLIAPNNYKIGTRIFTNDKYVGIVKKNYDSGKIKKIKKYFKTHSEVKAFGAKIIEI